MLRSWLPDPLCSIVYEFHDPIPDQESVELRYRLHVSLLVHVFRSVLTSEKGFKPSVSQIFQRIRRMNAVIPRLQLFTPPDETVDHSTSRGWGDRVDWMEDVLDFFHSDSLTQNEKFQLFHAQTFEGTLFTVFLDGYVFVSSSRPSRKERMMHPRHYCEWPMCEKIVECKEDNCPFRLYEEPGGSEYETVEVCSEACVQGFLEKNPRLQLANRCKDKRIHEYFEEEEQAAIRRDDENQRLNRLKYTQPDTA